MENRPPFSPLDPDSVYIDSINKNENASMILSLFNSPSQIISKIQEGSDIGWVEDSENSIFFTSFGSVQILINDEKKQIEINPISGKTEEGWENLINYIHDEDKKLMENIIEKFMEYSSIYSIREMEDEDVDGWEGFNREED